MQFIQSIILIVVTTIVTNLFTRKFYISDKDRIIKEKQFKIYEGLYINIVKNRVNEPILSCLAKKNIYHLINALITNENLYNYLNPLLYEQLTSLKDQKISDSDVLVFNIYSILSSWFWRIFNFFINKIFDV